MKQRKQSKISVGVYKPQREEIKIELVRKIRKMEYWKCERCYKKW